MHERTICKTYISNAQESFKSFRSNSKRSFGKSRFYLLQFMGKGADLAVEVKRNDYIKVNGRLMSRDVYVNGEETEVYMRFP